jgi:hypothetical protein
MHGIAVVVEFGSVQMAVAIDHDLMTINRTATVISYGIALMLTDSILEANWVLERTDIGQTEIATRALKLPMTARAVLLMVDGKSEVTQLQRKMAGLVDGMNILESLLSNGLIRRRHFSSDSSSRTISDNVQDSARLTEKTLRQVAQDSAKVSAVAQRPDPQPTPIAPPPPQTAPAVGKQRRSLALARMYLLDQMERMFGDRSEAARNLLRTATTREELLIVFADCREILEETTGPERARRIANEFYDLLPESTLARPPAGS